MIRVFRVARAGTTARHVAHTLLQTTMMWSCFLGALPLAIHAATTRLELAPAPFFGHLGAGLTLLALMSALGLGTGLLMAVRGRGTPLPLATARELVIAGAYRHVRNPMAIAGIGQGVAVGLILADWFVVGYALSGALVWHNVARPPEERDLVARFGPDYERYRAAVPLWRPRLLPYRPAADAATSSSGHSARKSASSSG